ncbi:hypothetical protein EV363DRAFT_1177280 [Boletus edulis]|uniref:Uncharacterized protein n=1 Tax=Boletus edulis BED1 TaxID=1328754 RepID=A0AAD4B9N7_BOLED|nr:hypothetical protein EV363DRAFT_1177280 [Boletus edulis]KAF8414737.1 hypothetical protein L210DRAFT_2868866 [Boletus edulis BED1]
MLFFLLSHRWFFFIAPHALSFVICFFCFHVLVYRSQPPTFVRLTCCQVPCGRTLGLSFFSSCKEFMPCRYITSFSPIFWIDTYSFSAWFIILITHPLLVYLLFSLSLTYAYFWVG